MVSVRIENFNDDVWDYVVLYARRTGVSTPKNERNTVQGTHATRPKTNRTPPQVR